jgi:oligopeptide/dipeptide ABC transporter ATP-binding protein
MNDNIIEVKNLKTYFYMSSGIAKAVDGVSFTLKKGETMGIVGESGSGKSVTASSIMRLVAKPAGRITDGQILFENKDIVKMKEKELRTMRGKDISMIFQDPMTSLDPVYKIGDQIVEVIKVHQKVSTEEARKMAIESLEMVGIPEAASRINAYPHEFSGGMRQRVMIAMAIVCNPKLIIADEPTTALDVTVQAQVLDLLKDLQKKMNTSILIITHNLGVIWEVCDTVMVMYAGKTVEYAKATTLYDKPLHPYTWGLLDSMPKLSQDTDKPLKAIKGSPPDLKLTGSSCNFHNRCPYAQDLCMEKAPGLIEIEEGHFVSCHFQTKEMKLKRKEDE